MTPESRKSGRGVDPSFTERELVERIVNQAIADGAFDQALQARLQGIADPKCTSTAIERHRRRVTRMTTALKVSRLLNDSGASR